MPNSRKDFLARSQVRQDSVACYMALRNCNSLLELQSDSDLEACAKGQRYVSGIYDAQYAHLVETGAKIEHSLLLQAVSSRRHSPHQTNGRV